MKTSDSSCVKIAWKIARGRGGRSEVVTFIPGLGFSLFAERKEGNYNSWEDNFCASLEEWSREDDESRRFKPEEGGVKKKVLILFTGATPRVLPLHC